MQFLQDLTTGDLVIKNNNFAITPDGTQEVAQRLCQNLRTLLGEWFLDSSLGVPYIQSILVKNPTHAPGILKNTITTTEGVQSLLAFSFTLDNQSRGATVTFKCLDIYGGFPEGEVSI